VTTIALQLDPTLLDNPDLDIRYQLPDLLLERSNGLIQDNAYDYVGDSLLTLFLETTDVDAALVHILDVINNVRLLENDLRKGTAVGFSGATITKSCFRLILSESSKSRLRSETGLYPLLPLTLTLSPEYQGEGIILFAFASLPRFTPSSLFPLP
jgi:hypothetical protein